MINKMADTLIIPIAGAIILGLFALVKWGGQRWLKNFEATTNKILLKLDSIKDQIDDLKTENALQTAYMHEIETRFEMRFQGNDRRFDTKREKLGEHDHRLSCLEKEVTIIKTINHGKK